MQFDTTYTGPNRKARYTLGFAVSSSENVLTWLTPALPPLSSFVYTPNSGTALTAESVDWQLVSSTSTSAGWRVRATFDSGDDSYSWGLGEARANGATIEFKGTVQSTLPGNTVHEVDNTSINDIGRRQYLFPAPITSVKADLTTMAQTMLKRMKDPS